MNPRVSLFPGARIAGAAMTPPRTLSRASSSHFLPLGPLGRRPGFCSRAGRFSSRMRAADADLGAQRPAAQPDPRLGRLTAGRNPIRSVGKGPRGPVASKGRADPAGNDAGRTIRERGGVRLSTQSELLRWIAAALPPPGNSQFCAPMTARFDKTNAVQRQFSAVPVAVVLGLF